jgi:hypothetical protein
VVELAGASDVVVAPEVVAVVPVEVVTGSLEPVPGAASRPDPLEPEQAASANPRTVATRIGTA